MCSVVNFAAVKLRGKQFCLERCLISSPCQTLSLFPSSPYNFMHCNCLANVLGTSLGSNTHFLQLAPGSSQLLTVAGDQSLGQREMEKAGLHKLRENN